MIGIRLNGRLGNQLFQYALAISLAKQFNSFFIIDHDGKPDFVKKYFKTNKLNNSRISRAVLKKILLDKLPIIYQNNDEVTSDILPLFRNNHFYYGFFQSELYFKNISNSVSKRLELKKVYKNAFVKKYGHLFKGEKILVVHYRLGDYLTWGNEHTGGINMSLPESFYLNALQEINKFEDYKVLLVTDDLKNAATKLPCIKNKLIISDSEIMDFQLLMHADKLIISNSSFAWWGAYLNKKHAEVFAPENWLGFKINTEMPSTVIPDRFKKVSVF